MGRRSVIREWEREYYRTGDSRDREKKKKIREKKSEISQGKRKIDCFLTDEMNVYVRSLRRQLFCMHKIFINCIPEIIKITQLENISNGLIQINIISTLKCVLV